MIIELYKPENEVKTSVKNGNNMAASNTNKCFENLKKHLGSGFAQFFSNDITVKTPYTGHTPQNNFSTKH